MKESGMNKLIKLLNEYDDNNWGVTDYGALFNKMNEGISETEYLQVISKEFGFIQRLVSKNKIEFREDFYLEDQHGGGFGEDEIIIMLLAIQENPITFLLSILK